MYDMCIRFINSDSPWYEIHRNYKDALLDEGWMRWFLEEHGFPAELAETGLPSRQLAELRSLLSETMDTIIAGNEVPQDGLDKINRYLAASPLIYEVKSEDRQLRLSLLPKKKGWNCVLSQIAASFIRMVSESDSVRFKRCENPDCRSVFYDASKNRTRKWCCNACSSLIKVRRHREKQKSSD
jgi:predicted RNA-binding Zn ribbon-like protein